MHKIKKLLRIIGTGFCFTCFGVGGLLASLFIFPFIILFNPDAEKRQASAQRMVKRMFHSFVSLMVFLGIISFKVKGAEYIKEAEGKIVIANHPSLIDVVLIVATLPRATCIVKQAVIDNPFMRAIVKTAGYIANKDPELFLKKCESKLNKGETLVLFPEGTRSVPGETISFQRGAANIALRARADFLPVKVSCQPATLTKSERWYQVPDIKPNFEIAFQPPLSLDTMSSFHESNSIASRKLTRDLEGYFIELL